MATLGGDGDQSAQEVCAFVFLSLGGSDDPVAQASAILEESDEREFERDDPTGQGLERRRSEDTVELPVISDDGRQDAPKP